jgi:hypothetical protein
MEEISTKEAAGIIGVLPRQVRWYWEKGLLPGRMIVDRLVFKRSDVEKFVKPSHPKNRWVKKPAPKAAGVPKKTGAKKPAAKEKTAPEAKSKRKEGNA